MIVVVQGLIVWNCTAPYTDSLVELKEATAILEAALGMMQSNSTWL